MLNITQTVQNAQHKCNGVTAQIVRE